MKLQLIRNATLRLEYAGLDILIDPMLGPKHSFEAFADIEKNPTVDLPLPMEQVLRDIDLVIISHLHQDHFDAAAQEVLNKDLPILCQPGDAEKIEAYGFENVLEIETHTQMQQISITRTDGQHGSGEWAERLNPVSGFVLQSAGEPSLYWIGDSIWCAEVEQTLAQFTPQLIVTHSGGAELGDSGPILMDAEQTLALSQKYPAAMLIATHLDALDHCKTTRVSLRQSADEAGIDAQTLRIPADGEELEWSK
jgi:L-ascorbate metabolism protein UlaG (beta-lactamase superfamily)